MKKYYIHSFREKADALAPALLLALAIAFAGCSGFLETINIFSPGDREKADTLRRALNAWKENHLNGEPDPIVCDDWPGSLSNAKEYSRKIRHLQESINPFR